MVGLGTLINVACIVAGGSIGLLASAIVGSIQDGLAGDWSTLALKEALDAAVVIAVILALV